MRLSEVFLRIGSNFTAWMVIYAYFIWLAVVRRAGCGADGDEIFRLLLGMAPLAAGAAFLLRSTRPFPDIHNILRWLGIPIFGLLFLTVPVIWQVFVEVNIGNGAICGAEIRAGWHWIWAPLQMIATTVCIAMVLLTWRPGTIEENEPVGPES